MATTCPITTADVKNHLRVDISEDDTLIEQIMLAATEAAEEYQRLTYITRSRTCHLDAFPAVIRPPYAPLVTVTTLKYIDVDGSLQTYNAANYRVDVETQPGRITEAYNTSWPSIRSITGAVQLVYTSGFGATNADTPDEIKAALKMIIAHLYENRQTVIDKQLYEVPMAAKMLLSARRLIEV